MSVPQPPAEKSAWPIARLGDIAEVRLGKMLDKAKHRAGTEMPYLRNINVRWGAIETDDLFEMFFKEGEHERYGLRAGDVLVCEGGEPGRAAVWDGRIPEVRYQKALHRVRFNAEYEPRLLVYLLELLAKTGLLERRFTGSTIKHLTRESLVELPIPVPPLDEQRRMVEEIEQQLTRLDAGVAALKRIQANLKRYRAAVLKAACKGRLVPTESALARREGRPYEPAPALLKRILVERRRRREEAEPAKMNASGKRPDADKWTATYKEPAGPGSSSLAEVPEGWCWVTLDQLAYVLEGGNAATAVSTPSRRRVLTSSAVRQGFVDFNDTRFYSDSAPKKADPYVQAGDLLFTRLSGTLDYVGNCAVVPHHAPAELEFPDRIFRARTVSLICSTYAQHCFGEKTLRQALEKAAKSTAGHRRISVSDLRAYLLPLPPLAEQNRIVAEVERRMSLADHLGRIAFECLCRVIRLRQSILATTFGERVMVPTGRNAPDGGVTRAPGFTLGNAAEHDDRSTGAQMTLPALGKGSDS
jgi:type I restriction enzyme, S subunit